MTIKDRIYEALKSVEDKSFYADTDYTGFPRVLFYLISNVPVRYSNKRHSNRIKYQVSYYSDHSLDVETDESLMGIIDALEVKGLLTTNWLEVVSIDEKENSSTYHYMLEVSG